MAMNKFVVENKQRISEVGEKLKDLSDALLNLQNDFIRFDTYLRKLPLEENNAQDRKV